MISVLKVEHKKRKNRAKELEGTSPLEDPSVPERFHPQEEARDLLGYDPELDYIAYTGREEFSPRDIVYRGERV